VPLMNQTAQVRFDRRNRRAAVRAAIKAFAQNPGLWWQGLRWLCRTLWAARSDLWAARGRINKLSFFIHDFMDACRLERERVHGCVFMVASAEGPISMCLHNAKRDAYILRPLKLETAEGEGLWDPLTGVDRVAIQTVFAEHAAYKVGCSCLSRARSAGRSTSQRVGNSNQRRCRAASFSRVWVST